MSEERPFSYTHRRLLERAVAKWGIDDQLNMASEECAEFTTAREHYRRERVNIDAVIEEIADLKIAMEQLSLYFGEDRINRKVREKLERLEERVEGDR